MKRFIILPVATVAAAVAVGIGCGWAFRNEAPSLRLPGTVEVQEVRPTTRVGGRVKDVQVHEGQLVEAGQVLVVLEAAELEAQRDQVAHKLMAARAIQRRAYAGPRPEEIAEAKGELAAAEAELDRAVREWKREQGLRAVSTDAAQIAARTDQQKWAGKVQAARARTALLVAGTREEDKAEADARVAELEARLRELETNVREATVRAAEPAVVEVVAVRKGDIVAANQPVVRLLRAEDLWVKAYVSEIDLGRLRLNQDVQVTVDAYKDRAFAGKVEYIASSSEFTPRNVQSVDERRHQVFGLKVRVTDPQGVFKAGMAAEVIVPVQ